MGARKLRDIFGNFATGVTVITCRNAAGEPHGATVTAFASISLDPALCQVTLARTSKVCGFLRDSPFGVNILGAEQADTALHFAGRPQSPGPQWIEGPTAPLLRNSAATVSCIPWAQYNGGDHVIFIGEVMDATTTDRDPLLFFRSTFRTLAAPSEATAWNGCMDDPYCGWLVENTSFTPLTL